jgi:energy-coupling factor transport system substrate-specific component
VPFVDADNVRIYPDETGAFTIPSTTHKLTVNSFVYTYSLIDPRVSLRLDGFDREDITVSRSDLLPVDYTNLKGRTYHFVIQVHDSMGRDSKTLSVPIVKQKRYYEHTWFNIFAAALLLICIEESVRLYIRSRTRMLERKQQESMTFIREITEAFAKVIDMKDKYTRGHSMRVAKYTARLAEELGCDKDTVEKYYRIALLHDIGKIGVPPEVLNKNGKLTDEEFETIKSHTSQGYEALKEISIMPELSVGAQSHHERPDGRGYPNHLKGDEIPRVAQIIAVADCFDAMYSNRPYRKRMNFDKAVSIIKEVSGTQL